MLTKTQQKVVANLAKCGRIGEACTGAGCVRQSHYNWIEASEEYKQEFEHAQAAYVEKLEKMVEDRAAKGSDILLMFITKAHAPNKYRDNVQVTGAGGGAIQVQITIEGVKSGEAAS